MSKIEEYIEQFNKEKTLTIEFSIDGDKVKSVARIKGMEEDKDALVSEFTGTRKERHTYYEQVIANLITGIL